MTVQEAEQLITTALTGVHTDNTIYNRAELLAARQAKIVLKSVIKRFKLLRKDFFKRWQAEPITSESYLSDLKQLGILIKCYNYFLDELKLLKNAISDYNKYIFSSSENFINSLNYKDRTDKKRPFREPIDDSAYIFSDIFSSIDK